MSFVAFNLEINPLGAPQTDTSVCHPTAKENEDCWKDMALLPGKKCCLG